MSGMNLDNWLKLKEVIKDLVESAGYNRNATVRRAVFDLTTILDSESGDDEKPSVGDGD